MYTLTQVTKKGFFEELEALDKYDLAAIKILWEFHREVDMPFHAADIGAAWEQYDSLLDAAGDHTDTVHTRIAAMDYLEANGELLSNDDESIVMFAEHVDLTYLEHNPNEFRR